MQIGGIEVFENLNELRHVQPRAKFDIVTLWDVIEHLRKPWIELEELFNFLKPGGLLLLSTMNTGCLRARIERGRWVNMVNPTHFYYFTRQSLSAVLVEEAGFGHITELASVHRYPQHGRWCSGCLTEFSNRATFRGTDLIQPSANPPREPRGSERILTVFACRRSRDAPSSRPKASPAIGGHQAICTGMQS